MYLNNSSFRGNLTFFAVWIFDCIKFAKIYRYFGRNLILERIKNGEELIFVDVVIEFSKNDTMLDKVLKMHDKQNPDACYVSESFIENA
jgi:hypothetical protein